MILTHRHLDHSSDVNVMIEAMTQGGFKKRGELFAPQDALDDDPVVLKYLRDFVEKIHILKEGGNYSLGKIKFKTPLKHIHGVETYGIKFKSSRYAISLMVDTKFFPKLARAYSKSDIIILNVVRHKRDQTSLKLDHLNLEDAKELIQKIKPKLAVLTHFGMTMVRAKPWEAAERLSSELEIKVISASDGLNLELEKEPS